LEIPLPSKDKMTKVVLEAHTILSDLNESNWAMFKNVVGALKGKLAKH
jgi:hypothetical protein